MVAKDFGIEVGKTYRPRKGNRSPERTVIWVSNNGHHVQYDGPAVKLGQRYPTVSAERFAKWAGLKRGES